MGRTGPETSIVSARISAEDDRAHKLVALAKQIFALLADGYSKPLRYSIRRGCAVYDAGARAYDRSSYTAEWRAAQQRLGNGQLRDRAANPYTVLQHLEGRYDVAVQAPSWTRMLVLDLDRPDVRLPANADGHEREAAEREADQTRDETLARVWAAFRFDETPARQPVLLRTPGGGYHLYFPLDRHWPVAWSRQILEHHLHRHGLGVKPGVLEIYPSGVPLRAPCGRGMALLRPQSPGTAEALDLQPLHARWVYGSSGGVQTAQLRRDIVPLLEAYLVALETQRRPLEQWLDPLPSPPLFDTVWGPWLRREKDLLRPDGEECSNQHIEDVYRSGGIAPKGGLHGVGESYSGLRGLSESYSPPRLGDLPVADVAPLGAGDSSVPRQGSDGFLLRGAAWWATLARLLSHGIPASDRRHDAALKVAWYFRFVAGLDVEAALSQVEVWLRAGLGDGDSSLCHRSQTLATKGPRGFLKETLREVRHYLEKHLREVPPTGVSSAGRIRRGRLILSSGDEAMLEHHLVVELRTAGRALLTFLAAHADDKGRVPGPVALSATILETLCGQTRCMDPERGQRRLANVLLERFEELGLLTRHRNHSAGRHARQYAVWYTFGSGTLPEREAGLGLVVGRRQVEEGELVAYTTGSPGARVQVQCRAVEQAVDTPNAWWRKMYERRTFTPAEFFAADERYVLPGPYRDRWPTSGERTAEKPPLLPAAEAANVPKIDGTAPSAASQEISPPLLEVGTSSEAFEAQPSAPVETAPFEDDALLAEQRSASANPVDSEAVAEAIDLAQIQEALAPRYPLALTQGASVANDAWSYPTAPSFCALPTELPSYLPFPPASEAANDKDRARGSTQSPPIRPTEASEKLHPTNQAMDPLRDGLSSLEEPGLATSSSTRRQPTGAEVMLQLHTKRLALGYPCHCRICERAPPGR